jgi:hypothetical protein
LPPAIERYRCSAADELPRLRPCAIFAAPRAPLAAAGKRINNILRQAVNPSIRWFIAVSRNREQDSEASNMEDAVSDATANSNYGGVESRSFAIG